MMKVLTLPKGAKEELGITSENGMDPIKEKFTQQLEDASEDEELKQQNERKAYEQQMLRELYGEGRYHLIPSFWRTLMYLKKQK